MQEILLQHPFKKNVKGSYLTRMCICIFQTANACCLKFLLLSCWWRARCLSLHFFIGIASFLLRCLHIQSELFIFFTLRFHIDKQFMMECPRPLVIKKNNCSLVTTSHNRTSSFFVFSFSSSIHQSCFIWAYPQILSRYRKKNNKVYCQPCVGEKDPISQKNSIFLLKWLMFLIHVDLIGLSGLL